jgi:peptidyl-tRNA hydrolase
MKEKTLIEMKGKVEAMTRVLQHVINEMGRLTELTVGTLEAVKLMPGYEEAIEQLKEQVEKSKEDMNGVIEQDTK